MILIKPGKGAALITFPSIEEVVKKILLRWYSDEKAKQYAGNVQRFFEENARFPEDAIYKLEDGVFYLLDMQNSTWKKTESTKTSYVISGKNSKFWEEFEKKLPYLNTYKADIQQTIFDTTKAMFDVEVQKTSFVGCDTKGITTVGINKDSAIKAALCNYVNPQEQEAYIEKILAEVFHSDDTPIFVIDKGITVAAITSSSISKDVNEKALHELLKKSFLADDAQELQIRIMNAIKYNVNHEEEVVMNENGEFVLNIGGLHVQPFGDNDEYSCVVEDENNTELFSELLKKHAGYHLGKDGNIHYHIKNNFPLTKSNSFSDETLIYYGRTYEIRLPFFTDYSPSSLTLGFNHVTINTTVKNEVVTLDNPQLDCRRAKVKICKKKD